MLKTYLTLILLSLVVMVFTACSAAVPPVVIEENPPPLAPTATQLPEQPVELVPATVEPSLPDEAMEESWQSITPPDESVTFELPASWRHYGQDTNWSPDEGKTLIGLRMGFNRPGQAVETGMLPENAQVLETQTEMINGTSVRRVRAAAGGTYETHLILVRPDSLVLDFLLRAPTEEALDDLYPVLVHAVESARFP